METETKPELKPLDFSEAGVDATFRESDGGLATRNRMRYALALLDRLRAECAIHEHEVHGYVGAMCNCRMEDV